MILSHKHKFIFFHVGKTAGSSLQIALSEYCGPKDVVSPIKHGRRYREKFKHQNYVVNGKRLCRKHRHMKAWELKSLMSKNEWSKYFDFPLEKNAWDKYFKFCFERNPWDKVVSFYFFQEAKFKMSLSEFIQTKRIEGLKWDYGYGIYTIDGSIVVDKVFLYEKLNEAVREIEDRFKLPKPLNLPRANSQSRTDKRSYKELLDKRSRDRISDVFKEEIKLFGYTF